MNFLAHIFVCGCLFLLLDAFWLGAVANRFYHDSLGKMLADKPRFAPAAAAYLIYLSALLYFVLEPALDGQSWVWLLKHAAFFGLAMYATHDLTNAATLRRWPAKLTILDMAWGTFLTVGVAAAGFAIFP
jgi:uncharacterized membrane protein